MSKKFVAIVVVVALLLSFGWGIKGWFDRDSIGNWQAFSLEDFRAARDSRQAVVINFQTDSTMSTGRVHKFDRVAFLQQASNPSSVTLFELPAMSDAFLDNQDVIDLVGRTAPCLVVLDKDSEVYRKGGVLTQDEVELFLAKHLEKPRQNKGIKSQ